MQHLELNHTFNSSQDQDGGPGDRWAIALVTAEEKATLAPAQRVLCSWGPGKPFPARVLSLGAAPNGEGRYFVIIDPEEEER